MLGRVTAAACLGASVLGPAAIANAATIPLLSPITRFKPPPPVYGTAPFEAEQETRFPGRLQNDVRVAVALEDDGSTRSIVATQRLVISRLGDFSFLVPAPATSVVPAPGSQAEPGLRNVGIVWQGFSTGRRVLAATARLSLDADRGLPLLVSVTRRRGGVAVRLIDIARRRTDLATGSPAPGALHAFLVRLRAAQRKADSPTTPDVYFVNGTTRGRTMALVSAPLRLRGTLGVPGRKPVRVDTVLGNGQPLERTFTLPGRVLPKIALRVDLLDPLEILPEPEELAAAGDALSTLQVALGSVALSWQYRHFLDSPDPGGPSSTTYFFRTAPQSSGAPAPTAERPGGGSDTLAIVLASTLGAAGLVALVVLWAHL
jgi:hypothetical protein